MKKLLFTITFLLLTPLSAFASYTYTRTPSGTIIYANYSETTRMLTLPVFHITWDNLSDFGFDENRQSFNFYLNDDYNFESPCYLVSDFPNGGDITFTLRNPASSPIITYPDENFGAIFNGYSDPACVQDQQYIWIEGDDNTLSFTIREAIPPTITGGVLFGNSGESLEVNQSGGSLLAAVGFVSSDTFSGIFPYLMLSVGVFLTFYIVQRIAIFWGEASGEKVKFNRKSQWTASGAIDKDVREFKKKTRSRIKRGLE